MQTESQIVIYTEKLSGGSNLDLTGPTTIWQLMQSSIVIVAV